MLGKLTEGCARIHQCRLEPLARWPSSGRIRVTCADNSAIDRVYAIRPPIMHPSRGDITALLPWAEMDIEPVIPLRIEAGINSLLLTEHYGGRIAYERRLDWCQYEQPEQMWAEIERVVPVMKEGGGYIAGTDHSVPDTVPLEVFREFVARCKVAGSYD